MPKKEKKRLQVVISDEQDALLTKLAYELSSPEQLVSKSEVIRLLIESGSQETDGRKEKFKELLKKLEAEGSSDEE
ncbi:MAG: transcriptional regulator [Thermaceae bacterium]|nr:transcriptional regulator [Thermaceae bacterium]